MARAIDKDYLLKHKRKVRFFGIGPDDESWGYAVPAEIIENAPTITPPNEWVSVEESLPEEKQRVIVRCERVGTSVGWILWGNWMTDIGPGAGKVTHWMPLPAPPGKDNNVPTKAQNEPLTIKQLREMDGEPVYDYLGQEWYVIQEYYGHELTMTDGTRFFDDDEIDGVDKRFYRRPPEGEEDT